MVRVVLITANVGSVFESMDSSMTTWMKEVVLAVQVQNPEFVAIHFQETGGKYCRNGSNVVDNFFRILVENFTSIGLYVAYGFIDSDSSIEAEFTALSSVYFMREKLTAVQIWDFHEREYTSVSVKEGKLHSAEGLKLTGRMRKEKFPQHFFPDNVWSRKGFLWTRWNLQGTCVELVNIHLFHDSSNLMASATSPSPFAENRKKGLSYVLDRLKNDDPDNLPRFIFGDFNFRLNTFKIFDILGKESAALTAKGIKQNEQFEVDVKCFKVNNHEERFKHDYHWLRPYDFEASQFGTVLQEYDISFHPTYPFDEKLPDKFMRSRCPAYCDRVLFQNATGSISKDAPVEYNLIGSSACMGDHKPVYLSLELKPQTSTDINKDDPSLPLMPTSIHSGISTPSTSSTKLKCGFVSFLRENLNLRRSSRHRDTNANNTIYPASPSNSKKRVRNSGKCCVRSSGSSKSSSTANNFVNEGTSTSHLRIVPQDIVISKDNEEIDENKDTQTLKRVIELDKNSLKENFVQVSLPNEAHLDNHRSAARQRKCCNII